MPATVSEPATSFWRDRPVLVTGATGLLGGWLLHALLERGANVGALVRDRVPRAHAAATGLLDRCWIAYGDVEDFDLVERVLNEYEVDTVFHLAAQTIVTIANRNPRSTFETNVRGTWNLLEACRRVSTVKRILVASSDKAYGDHGESAYTEDMPMRGRHPYDVSKSCADLIALSYHATYGLPVCVTRCGNLYGGGDLNFNRIVPGTIRSALHGERPIIRSDGLFVRDYFYALDGALAYVTLAERMEDRGVAGEAFNFSNDQPLNVIEVTRKVLEAAGRPELEPQVLNETRNEIRYQSLNSEKARRMLDWSPRWTLDEALRDTVEWYRAHLSPQGGRPQSAVLAGPPG
jgi:CDP-glucose 4,6-dehydratase